MENSYFIYSKDDSCIKIERFHNCIWEFKDNSSLVEFGIEINQESLLRNESVELNLYIPWLTSKSTKRDLYEKLKDSDNSRFIFNDSVLNTKNLDDGRGKLGVIHYFKSRNILSILPVSVEIVDKKACLKIDLKHYNEIKEDKGNVYVRFSLKPDSGYVSTRKNGIAKSTVIYDIKVNERRNLPEELIDELNTKNLCKIKDCFSFNILPNSYDIVFFDNTALKNVRMLEYDAFKKYIDDDRVRKDDLMVVFNKKCGADSFSFFSIYAKERIGMGQFLVAIFFNMICGLLFFIASAKMTSNSEFSYINIFKQSPIELSLSLTIISSIIIAFFWPKIKSIFR